jgi:hypothetical protein
LASEGASVKRKYTTDELLRIEKQVSEAKENNEDVKQVYSQLSEEFQCTPWSIEQRYYAFIRKQKKLKEKEGVIVPSALKSGIINTKTQSSDKPKNLPKSVSALNKFIFDTIIEAKKEELDVGVVKRHLMDKFGLTQKALDIRFYETQKYFKHGGTWEPDGTEEEYTLDIVTSVEHEESSSSSSSSSEMSPVSLTFEKTTELVQINTPPTSPLLFKVEKIIQERDMYKQLYESLKSEMDKISALLN